MAFTTLLYEHTDRLTTITLNRPDRFNAFDDIMSFELQDALKQASKDENTRCIVITGAGKAFCSGQDLKASDPTVKRSFIDSLHKRYNPIIRAMRNMPKPIICKMNGVAAGAGCSLALACDMIIASDQAKLIEVFINIGLVPDSGSSYFLPRLVGMAKAFELCSMGTHVTAEQALDMGIINKMVPTDQLDTAVKEATDYFINAPTKAIGIIKKMLNKSTHSDLDTMLDYEAYCQEIAGNTNDYNEGVQAFIEKRKPVFKGK